MVETIIPTFLSAHSITFQLGEGVTRTFRTPLTLSHMGDFKGTLSFSEDIYLIQNKPIVFNFLLEIFFFLFFSSSIIY